MAAEFGTVNCNGVLVSRDTEYKRKMCGYCYLLRTRTDAKIYNKAHSMCFRERKWEMQEGFA